MPERRGFAVTDPHPALEGALGRHPVPTGEGQSKIKTDQSGILLMAFLSGAPKRNVKLLNQRDNKSSHPAKYEGATLAGLGLYIIYATHNSSLPLAFGASLKFEKL